MKSIPDKYKTERLKAVIGDKDVIGSVEMKFIRTQHMDIHAGRGTIGNCIDELLCKLDSGDDKLMTVTVHLDEERM
jgi:hypothetical protein